MARRGRFFRVLSWTFLAGTVAGLFSPVQAGAKAVAVLGEGLGLSVPRPFAAPVIRLSGRVGGVEGDLYYPGAPAPAVVLLPGATPAGRDDPRVIRVARSIARAERIVFVPEMALYRQRLEGSDIEDVVAAVAALDASPEVTHGVSLLGFSYGGSFALLAAADPRIAGRVRLVATFGAYFDLGGVIQAVTTDVSLVDGRPVPWGSESPQADRVLRGVALQLVPPDERDALRPLLSGGSVARGVRVPPDARAVALLVRNRDPGRTPRLVEALPPEARARLARFSPSSVASRIAAPVVAMHSTDDPAVPYAELARLALAMPRARILTVHAFRHVDFRPSSPGSWLRAAGDLWTGWRFTAALLGAQE